MSDIPTAAPPFPEKRVYTKEQIAQVREAIEHEKSVKAQHDAHEAVLVPLRKEYDGLLAVQQVLKDRATSLRAELDKLEETTFDYSDDTTIAAAEDMLRDMERAYESQEG